MSSIEEQKELVGRVIGEEKNHYRVQFDDGRTAIGTISGRLKYKAVDRKDYPAVGDWVVAQWTGDGERVVIDEINERKSTLARAAAGGTGEIQIIATNIDWVLIATSANDDLNLRRLDRYLSLAWSAGAKPAILVTKADLVEDVGKIIVEIQERFPGVPVHLLRATLEDPTPLLAPYFAAGFTAVVVGSSGVGKSTLINRILGSEVLVTREIREDDGRGRHTTTSRYLFKVGEGALIDTPGMREIQLTDEDEGLEKLFAEIDAIAGRCKFGNCAHVTEPGCAILAALDTGDLTKELWDSYLKLLKEVEHQQRKQMKHASRNQKLKQKQKDQR